MSGANVKFSPGGPRVRGASASEDFEVSFVASTKSYPLEQYVWADGYDYQTVSTTQPYVAEGELTLQFSGNTEGAVVQRMVGPGSSNYTLVGNHLRRTGMAVGPGTVAVKVRNRFVTKTVTTPVMAGGPGKWDHTTTQTKVREGSLAWHIADTLLRLLPSQLSSIETNCQFLPGGNYEPGNVSVQANPGFFLKHIDWSGIAIATRTGESWPIQAAFPVELISPRHGIAAAHTKGNMVGQQIAFRRPDGSVQTVTCIAERRNVTGNDQTSADIVVVYFDAPVTGCAVLKLLPPNLTDYMPTVNKDGSAAQGNDLLVLPAITRQANRYFDASSLINYVSLESDSPKFLTMYCFRYAPTLSEPKRLRATNAQTIGLPSAVFNHARTPYSGDSGSPFFYLIQENPDDPPTPVLITTTHLAGGDMAFGPELVDYQGWLQENMDSMATAAGDQPVHKLSFVDLSRFPRYLNK